MAPRIEALPARHLATFAGVAAVAAHFAFFQSFFPNPDGSIGADYGYFLPHLLDGELWRRQSGWPVVPWFTPSFCGGLPKFPNPQALYYSLPQWLTFFVGPLAAVRWTLLAMGAAGYLGCYLLQRRLFGFPRPTAVLGATLFLFNTLFSSRMLVGHLTFHGFMLVPFLPLLLLHRGGRTRTSDAARIALAALVLAYLASHAIAHLLFQALAITLLVACLQGAFGPRTPCWGRFMAGGAAASALAMALCAAKLVAMAAHLEQLPRTLYTLPGIASSFDLLQLAFVSVFLSPWDALLQRAIVNSEWALLRHEFEFGVGAVPLYLVGAAVVLQGKRLLAADAWRRLRGARGLHLVGAVLLLLFPLAINLYEPGWNTWLKSLPVFENSSSLFRWWSLFVLPAALLAGLVLERTPVLRELRPWVAAFGIAACLGLGWQNDRSYYRQQPYDPRPVQEAFEAERSGRESRIHSVGVARGGLTVDRNDTMTNGVSQLVCYETLFGFRMENFPVGALRVGSVFREQGGALNLKDPSCYVFPEANGCAPGDPFPASRRADAEAFVSYRPFPFVLPPRQHAANVLSTVSLCAVGGLLLFASGAAASARLRARA